MLSLIIALATAPLPLLRGEIFGDLRLGDKYLADVKLTLRDRWMRLGKPPPGSSPDIQQQEGLNQDVRRDVKEGEGSRLRK